MRLSSRRPSCTLFQNSTKKRKTVPREPNPLQRSAHDVCATSEVVPPKRPTGYDCQAERESQSIQRQTVEPSVFNHLVDNRQTVEPSVVFPHDTLREIVCPYRDPTSRINGSRRRMIAIAHDIFPSRYDQLEYMSLSNRTKSYSSKIGQYPPNSHTIWSSQVSPSQNQVASKL